MRDEHARQSAARPAVPTASRVIGSVSGEDQRRPAGRATGPWSGRRSYRHHPAGGQHQHGGHGAVEPEQALPGLRRPGQPVAQQRADQRVAAGCSRRQRPASPAARWQSARPGRSRPRDPAAHDGERQHPGLDVHELQAHALPEADVHAAPRRPRPARWPASASTPATAGRPRPRSSRPSASSGTASTSAPRPSAHSAQQQRPAHRHRARQSAARAAGRWLAASAVDSVVLGPGVKLMAVASTSSAVNSVAFMEVQIVGREGLPVMRPLYT